MSKTKTHREKKRQLGQFLTPLAVARRVIEDLPLTVHSRVLEPSFGDGSFIVAVLERFASLRGGQESRAVVEALERNVVGVEIDRDLHDRCIERVCDHFELTDPRHALENQDFFRHSVTGPDTGCSLFGAEPGGKFDVIIGNPPFGGTIDPSIQDALDARFGERDGLKIKKETYSFFIVACVEALRPGGTLRFICSDTFLTIPTMKGLREFLLNRGRVVVRSLDDFSDETNQPMVVLDFRRGERAESVSVDGREIARDTINLTGNRSWRVCDISAPMFRGPKLADYLIASSGMTIGNNELFVRAITNDRIVEPFEFEFFDDPITLARERERARLGHVSPAKQAEITERERRGETRRNVRAKPLSTPREIKLPHSDYRFYNKASSEIIYAPPTHAVYWRDDGDAVITFKKNGNWYLNGVGGMPYFKREGLSWQLISPRLNTRYLPPGYILDSGAPCAFLKPGVDPDELWFILGWTLVPACSHVLKKVLNHTRNIQSKDFERLPYPYWVSEVMKSEAVATVRALVQRALRGERFDRQHHEVAALARLYSHGALGEASMVGNDPIENARVAQLV